MLCQLLVLQDALSALLTHERKVTSLILNAVKKLSKNKDLTEFTKYNKNKDTSIGIKKSKFRA